MTAGQFLTWRFLTGPGWTRAHPYSLSAAPDGRSLRITVKALGDGSALVRSLRPGTRAIVEGPYGRLTERPRTRPRVAFIGAGVGITPLRALAEGLPYAPGDAVLLHARHRRSRCSPASSTCSPAERGLHVLWLPGRRRAADSWLGDGGSGATTSRCCAAGCPTSPTATSTSAVRRRGRPPSAARSPPPALPAAQLHVENFGW